MTRVAVVGGGVMGCAAAWALTERGADVTLYEQFELDHVRGSSHGRSRIVRLAYPEPEWVRLCGEAMAGWRELEAQSGNELLGLYGLVELTASAAQSSAAALDACDVDYRLLGRDAARALGADVPAGWTALHQPEAGIVRADRARHAFLDVARSRGAEVQAGVRVDSLDDVEADAVVVTAGSWIKQLVPDVPVRVTRETVAYFRLDHPQASIVELSEETRGHGMYSLHDPVHGLKAGAHHAGPEVDPRADGEPDPALVERIAAWVRARLPDADPAPVAADTCLYTSTADQSFLLERRGRVVLGSPCSGHGFKFAPVVGRRLAELAVS
ncbi:MAG: sarcosine oxidase [Actinomycetota bacterium]